MARSSFPPPALLEEAEMTQLSIAVEVEALPFQSLDVYVAARELAALVHRARISDPELRDQATRAAKSVFLNLCEGLPSDSGPMRRKHFALANGSLHEVVGAVDLAYAIGALAPEAAHRAQHLAVRVKRMLRALTR
jgi:four helix bundle protein